MSKDKQNLGDTWNELDESTERKHQLRFSEQENDGEENDSENINEPEETYDALGLNPPRLGAPTRKNNFDIKKMAEKSAFRLKILGFTGENQLKICQNPFAGSCKVKAYDIDKDGNKKIAFSIRYKVKKGQVTARWGLPKNSKMEGKYARALLDGFKVGGCTHFELPPSIVEKIGGEGLEAFWKSAGKTQMVPILCSAEHPDAPSIGPGDVEIMLNELKNAKKDTFVNIEFKKNLLNQLLLQEAYAKQKNPNHTTESTLQTYIDELTKSERSERANLFNIEGGYFDTMVKKVQHRAKEGSEGKDTGYDFIETQAAYRALVAVSDYYNGEDAQQNKRNYEGTPQDNSNMDIIFHKELERQKEIIARKLKASSSDKAIESIQNGTNSAVAGQIRMVQRVNGREVESCLSTDKIKDDNTFDIRKYYDNNGQYIAPKSKSYKDGQTPVSVPSNVGAALQARRTSGGRD